MSTLEQQFHGLVDAVKNATINFQPNNTEKLKMYAFYKQATVGDVEGDCPSMINMVERAKWSAWNAIKGWDKQKAMQSYVDMLKDK